jgi:T5SS/PEP-CTERM-associated repeat protein
MVADFRWIASDGGDVTDGANWSPYTNLSPGTTPPGTADEAEFIGPGGTITGNISVLDWVIDSGVGLYTFTGDTTADYFSVSASASLTGTWTQNGSTGYDYIDIAAGTFTMGSTAALIANNVQYPGLVVDGALVANGGTISAKGEIVIGESGNGTLSANSGATLSAASIYLAVAAGTSGTLDLLSSTTASVAGFLVVGDAAGGSGATVDVNGATLTDQGQVQVGYESGGVLTVEGGGVLSTSASLTDPFLVLGDAGVTGSADVTGSGSALNAGANQIVVGAGGSGTLTVQNSATLIAGALEIGVGGAGTFDIESGATVTSDGADLGLQSSSHVSGTATVLLDAAEWLSNGQIEVGAGSGGTAGLQIEDGATLRATTTLASTTPFLYVNETVSGDATVDIGGAKTVLNAGSNSVVIGATGYGTLTVHDGATLDAGSTGSEIAFLLGAQSGSVGMAIVSGVTTTVDVTGPTAIGDAGDGTLDIGGTFTAAGNFDVAVDSSASGAVDVSGIGSDLAIGGQLVIGGAATAGGTGAVTLASGGALTAASLYLYSGGTLTIDSTSGAEIGNAGMGVTGQLVIDAGVTAGGSGEIAAPVTDDGDLAAQGGTLTVTGQATGNGVFEVATGAVFDLQQPGDVRIAFLGSTGTADLGTASGSASLTQFSGQDTLRLVGIGAGATPSYSGDTATVSGPDGTWTFAFSGAAPHLNVTTQGIDALVTLCFAKGTLIATPAGDVPVEHLAVGDPVLTLRGEARPIAWIGTGRVLATRGRRSAATPVIVRKGALGDNVPHHDLRVTKGHALYIDGALVPAEFLVNHRSIVWDDRAQEVTLYHIELGTHEVLLANGAPAESYRDDGNRWLFQNANSGWDLPPCEPCAPLLTGGPVVDTIWRRLLDRAGPRPGMRLTDDPDLHLVVDWQRVDPVSRHGSAHIFRLPAEPSSVRLVSRAGVPAELGVARDPRALGVAVRQVVLRQGKRFRLLRAADRALADGFHAFEADNGLRWTDGDAGLPMALFRGFGGPMELVLHVGGTARYLLPGEVLQAAA